MAPRKPAAALPVVTLDNFLTGIAHRGIRAGFAAVMAPQRTVTRTEAEFDQLLSLFRRRPIAVPWEQWVKQGGNIHG
jgi:hypothetical protein